jgi:saccharopine dehydrogenase-like NADP-dependent oxidoreductase
MSEEKRKTIGILGGYGVIGFDACRWLLNTTPHAIIIGGRNREKGVRAADDLGGAVRFMTADVDVPSSLEAFCSECNVVVNCTGPSRLVLDKVARVALEKGIDYVDPSGDEPLYNILSPHSDKIREKGLCFILSAGVYPGLSELLPDYIVQSSHDRVDRIRYYYCSWGELSFGSAYDYICTIEEGTGQGWVHLQDGKKEKSFSSQDKTVCLPSPVETVSVIPLLTDGLVRVAKDYDIRTIYEYMSIGKTLLSNLIAIVGEESYKTEREKEQSARILVESAAADMENAREELKTAVMFHLSMEGVSNGSRRKSVTTLFHPHGNQLTSIVVANTARLVAEGAVSCPGCHYLEKGVDVPKFIEILERQGIRFDQSITGQI